MKTIIGIVIKDIKVETTIMLDMLSTISFGEYIEAIKYVKIALGIADWINKTPAANPSKFKYLIKPNPIMGPIITLTAPRIDALVQETTWNLDRAIPKDIKTKKIVV